MARVGWLLLLVLGAGLVPVPARAEVVVENPEVRLVLGDDGRAESLVQRATGRELLAPGVHPPAFSVTQDRPYDNELQLGYPAGRTVFPAGSLERSGDTLTVAFQEVGYEARVLLRVTDAYLGFRLLDVSYGDGARGEAPVDEVVFLQLPVAQMDRFGEWLDVMSDDTAAVCLLATDPRCRIDSEPGSGFRTMRAGGEREVGIDGAGAALIVTGPNTLLDRIARVEEDFDLPRGVESRRRPEQRWSYYEAEDATPETIGQHLAYAKQGGFRLMLLDVSSFSTSTGSFPWTPEYRQGIQDLRRVTDRIRAAGLIPGLRFRYNKAQLTDPYVTPVPDPRLHLVRMFTLAEPAGAADTVLAVEEDPRGAPTEGRARLLLLGREIVSYTGFTTEPPYRFTGCRRGDLKTTAEDHDRGFRFGLLDKDSGPYLRFDPSTTLPEEVAERIGTLYRDGGFAFAYFDGAEDVPPPYWYAVSQAQLRVYRQLQPAPIFSEGSCRSHFSWHILTRGNAYDIFEPEEAKAACDRYPSREAARMVQDDTRINFGWLGCRPPNASTAGTQADILDHVIGRAAGWDCPVSFQVRLRELEQHPRAADLLETFRRWEEVRLGRGFTEAERAELRESGTEHTLVPDGKDGYELVPVEEIHGTLGDAARAYLYTLGGKPCVTYWHVSGTGKISMLPPAGAHLRLLRDMTQEVPIERSGSTVLLPAGGRLTLEAEGMTADGLAALFRAAQWVGAP